MDDTDLTQLPVERLVEMVKDKRKAEASLRQRLRDAEGRADKAEASVLAFQREAFEQQATDAGVASTALADLSSHIELGNLLGDDGTLDGAKAGEALKALRAERPHLFSSGAHVTTGTSARFDGAGDSDQPATWADVLQP
ncbi:hypothetical protein [Demequina iriomotensis]|uniref:hypothetical protein n=1 Tax=Demequina iriomotensis TaxID=1536641 RepID=UPI000782CE73|nr:hypothetical protein [Demequina iriomotensis]